MDIRLIIDTNLLISAIIKPIIVPGKVLATSLQTGKLCFSVETQEEVSEVLMRNKFDRYMPENERMAKLETIFEYAVFFQPTETITACRDPKDDKFLSLALIAHPSFIITGDKDLLVLHPFRGINIVSAADFIALH